MHIVWLLAVTSGLSLQEGEGAGVYIMFNSLVGGVSRLNGRSEREGGLVCTLCSTVW
jgi:hypothetical protein